MSLLILIWLFVATVLIIFAVKDGIFSLPLTRDKLSTRVFLTLTVLCWPLLLLLCLVFGIVEKIEDKINEYRG